MARNLLLPLLALLCTGAAALDDDDYFLGKVFHGDGTYYGTTEVGNCALRNPRPAFYKKYVPVAINTHQYEGMCGACIEVTGNGEGKGENPIKGTFKAYIMDRCPECAYGDIDLAKAGDGRWKVSWKVIPCEGEKRISFQFEGSHEYYLKMQPRGMKTPAKKVEVNDKPCTRTQDNHWTIQNDDGFEGKYKVDVETVLGVKIESRLSGFSGVVYGGTIPGGKKQKHRKPARCVPKWGPCTGPKNKWGTKRCCGGFRCVRPKQKNFVGNRCEPPPPKPAKCVPKWGPCTGPRNKWGTKRCCGGFRCVRPKQKNFVGNRCEPPPPKPAKCVPKWGACRGPRNKWGTKRCCGGFWCVRPKQANFVGHRCEPPPRKPAKCVPRYGACTGPRNKWGTKRCCDGWWCRRASQANFVGNRCEPPFSGCRKGWARCGTHKRWTNWNGEKMGGRLCCAKGFSCRWATDKKFKGYRCERG